MYTRPVLSQEDLEMVITALNNELDRLLFSPGSGYNTAERFSRVREVKVLINRHERLRTQVEERIASSATVIEEAAE